MNIRLTLLLALLWTTTASAMTLERDARWEGRRTLAETIHVPSGVTLTLAPGSQLEFTAGGLEVTGRLVAERTEFLGRDWLGIVLKNCDQSTRLTAVTVAGARTGILVQGGSPRLEELELRGNRIGIELRGRAAGVVQGSRFVGNSKVGLMVKDDSTTRITACSFDGNGKFGAYLYRSQPAVFRGNRFTGNGTGLMIAFHGTDPRISDNLFTGNEHGIQVDRAARPMLEGNRVVANRIGLHLYRRSDPLVRGNLVAENDIGILVGYSSYPQIVGNDLVANGLALRLEYQSSAWEEAQGAAARGAEVAAQGAFGGQGRPNVTEEQRRARDLDGTVEATGNWWGEAATRELEKGDVEQNPSFIFDGRDQPTFREGGRDYPLDRVLFAPWRRQPVTEFKP